MIAAIRDKHCKKYLIMTGLISWQKNPEWIAGCSSWLLDINIIDTFDNDNGASLDCHLFT